MKLIVGLGNPGEKFLGTRHNFGWLVIDRLLKDLGENLEEDWQLEDKFESELARVKYRDTDLILAKPLTYMNNSGRAVERIKNFYKLDQSELVLVYDEVNLNLGSVRLRKGGSAGGHNGVASVIHHTGSADFWRVRLGVGDEIDHRHDLTGFVLGKFKPDEQQKLSLIIDEASQLIIKSFISSDPEETTINVGE
ncbi:aminoacyl-tRNA hydrolase [Candidatus Berkelbacteria bacterium]|nr:aminoacyl-tRNA hydrolase [Candidatus Berkelbacteria bacterium]